MRERERERDAITVPASTAQQSEIIMSSAWNRSGKGSRGQNFSEAGLFNAVKFLYLRRAGREAQLKGPGARNLKPLLGLRALVENIGENMTEVNRKFRRPRARTGSSRHSSDHRLP
jgi:hypothetical protein